MSAAEQLARLGPYLGRLLEDEYIQEQIAQTVLGLREASHRAAGRRASDAIKDRRLRSQLSEAFSSLVAAVSALTAKPVKRKRLPRRALLFAGAGAAAALAWRAKSTSNDQTTWQGGVDG